MFFSTLVTTLFKMAVLAAVGYAGIVAGKKLRDSKDAKADSEA